MTQTDREQLGWEIVEVTWDCFKKRVVETWGAETPYINRALEDAIREFLDNDPYAPVASRLNQIIAETDLDSPTDRQTELLANPTDAPDSRTTVWTSIHAGLKQELAAFADENEYPKWLVLTAAVRAYTTGGRAHRLQETLSSDAVSALTAESPESTTQLTEASRSTQVTATTASPLANTRNLSSDDIPQTQLLNNESRDGSDTYDVTKSDSAGEVYGEPDASPVQSGFEAHRSQQIDDVITRLSGGDEGLPAPFSRGNLYQTAAEVGIPVWKPDQKEEFTDRLLDRIHYMWDADTRRFVPQIDEHLEDVISTAADSVTTALETELSQPLREAVAEWCDQHGFDMSDRETSDNVARQAVFNLLLKTTLYEWYHQHDIVPELPANTREALRHAEDWTDNPAFDEYVLDELVWLADEAELTAVVDARYRLLRSIQPAEDIGRLYETLLPKDNRRTLGQFRTPPALGTLMRRWAASGDDSVLDPGLGAGGLSSPGHPRWAGITAPTSITGVDRSQLALLMGTTALTLARQSHTPKTTDFLELSPEELSTEVDAIICNPPYTRSQALSSDYKEALNTQAERETNLDIHRKSPLYAYFYYHAEQFLDPGDHASFITPQQFLVAEYGESLKQYLLSEFDIKALVLIDPAEGSVFDEALTTSLVTFLEATDEADPTGPIQFIKVTENSDIGALLDTIRSSERANTEWKSETSVRQENVTPDKNWQAYFDPVDIETSHLTPFSEIADIKRGISTGENDFFCLTEAEVTELGIDQRYLSRLIRKATYLQGYDFRRDDWDQQRDDGTEVWLLYHLEDIDGVPETIQAAETDSLDTRGSMPDSLPESDTASANVIEYLWSGLTEHEELAGRREIQRRPCWYRVDRREAVPILIPYMSRTGFRAVLNETDARHLNNVHGVTPEVPLEKREVKALLAYLNSRFVEDVVRRHQRTYTGGLHKIEPGDLENVPVLDPREVRDDVVTTLAEKFDQLRDVARRGDSEESVRTQIDSILQRELGV